MQVDLKGVYTYINIYVCILTCMPRFNIFVRDEDLELWEAIEDRPRWVHDALRATGSDYPKAVRERKEIEKLIEPVARLFKLKEEISNTDENIPIVGVPAVSANPGKGLVMGKAELRIATAACKHGLDPKMCKFAKSGKPCK